MLVLNVDMDSLVQFLNLSFIVGYIYICPCVYCEYIFLKKNKTNKKRPRKKQNKNWNNNVLFL